MIRSRIFGLAVMSMLVIAVTAQAETVARFNLASTSTLRDISFDGMELGTTIDTSPASAGGGFPGGQISDLEFEGFLDFQTDIPSNAIVSFTGLQEDGAPFSVAMLGGTVIEQQFTGGSFFFLDQSKNLLLAGDLGMSVLSGTTTGGTALLTNADVTFTSGSLLPFVDPSSGKFSISMVNVQTGAQQGLRIVNNQLAAFTADANGQLEASAVPEPSSFAALGFAGILFMFVRNRRRRAANHFSESSGVLNKLVSTTVPAFLAALIFLASSCSSNADAGVIARVNLNGTNFSSPDVQFVGGVFSTVDDGVNGVSSSGDQQTSADFETLLSSISSIAHTGSFTFQDIIATGPATVSPSGNFFQGTDGGIFRLFSSPPSAADPDTLLLEGKFGVGLITSSTTTGLGGFSSTGVAFTDGTLLADIPRKRGNVSFSFTSVRPFGMNPLDFQADTTGLITSEPVPEPGTLFVFAAMGLIGLMGVRRRFRLTKGVEMFPAVVSSSLSR